MKNLTLLFVLFISSIATKAGTVKGSLESRDTTDLHVITIRPDSFPVISVVFEAIKQNAPIFGLVKEDIKVYEDGQECKIIELGEISNNYPINISVVIDHSGSMGPNYFELIDYKKGGFIPGVVLDSNGIMIAYPDSINSPLKDAKRAVKNFLSEFSSSKDSIQIIGFSTEVDVVTQFSTDTDQLQATVDSMNSDLMTAFLDALHTSVQQLQNRKGIRIVVALTDGLDNSSHVSLRKVTKLASESNIPIFTVGLGDVDKKFLEKISKQTNGAFFYTEESEALDEIYQTIQKRIKAIYDLRYESENLSPADSVREIKIEFEIDSLYLTNNIHKLDIPKEAFEAIKAKKKRAKYIIYGSVISATVVGSGLILFAFRRRKKKKQAGAK